ncbi:hypothetical protein HYV50_04055 [Candidatus Pacearchaeota archaeon]|nr:hypothetical protein [Candidatus Pacearchaeota archaeon]
MSSGIRFFTGCLMHMNEIGTIVPSSKYVGRKMAKNLESRMETIVELGGGTGVITKELLNKMNSNQRLLCFEINKEFCKTLIENWDGRLEVINDDAINMPSYLNGERPGLIVSTLPLAIMTNQKHNLLRMIKENLSERGKFVQLQYFRFDGKIYCDYFSHVLRRRVLFNLPPAFVYTCYN